MRKFYGVGIGPGDPELITLKAIRVIESSDYVFVPASRGESTAKGIALQYLEGKKVVELDFPMGKDNADRYKSSAREIDQILKDGQVGSFLTLGDPMTYSTYIYLMGELGAYDFEVETIPGITSFNAAASKLLEPLTVRGDSFYLCDGEVDTEVLKRVDSIAILKTNKYKKENLEKLEKEGFEYRYVRRCTRADEEIIFDRDKIIADSDYMSLIIGRRS